VVSRIEPGDPFQSIWRGHARGWAAAGMMAGMAGTSGAVAVALALLGGHAALPGRALAWVGAVFFLAGVPLQFGEALASCAVVVRINVYAVQVRPGLLPFAGLRIPVRGIVSVRATIAAARPWRSWGWWWRAGRRRTAVVRPGPCLLLGLRSGRSFLVSVDRPDEAIATLRRLAVLSSNRRAE
jgi:hypothetical protein